MNEIKIFEKQEFGQVRVATINGEPFFIAKDVTQALGYVDTDQAIRLHCKYAITLKPVDFTGLTESPRGMNAIPESDLYRLILKSQTHLADKFQDWVCEDVLPSIRKHGIYMNGQPKNASTDEIISLLEIATKALKDEHQKRLEAESAKVIAEAKNSVLMHVSKTYTATQVAKECGLRSATELNKILSDMKIQFYQNGTWVPYADYADLGYFHIKQDVLDTGRVIYHRRITQLGREFIIGKLKDCTNSETVDAENKTA